MASGSSFTCSDCNAEFDKRTSLAMHVKRQPVSCGNYRHKSSVKEVTFASSTEFNEWKCRLEDDSAVNFVKDRADKKTDGGAYAYYRCSRSGVPRPSAADADIGRAFRAKGPVQTGVQCTAFIRAKTSTEGFVIATFCAEHTGHGKEVQFQTVAQHVKDQIATWGFRGLTAAQICQKLREEYSEEERPHFICLKTVQYYLKKAGLKSGHPDVDDSNELVVLL